MRKPRAAFSSDSVEHSCEMFRREVRSGFVEVPGLPQCGAPRPPGRLCGGRAHRVYFLGEERWAGVRGGLGPPDLSHPAGLGDKNFRSCFHAHGNSGSATAVFRGKIAGSLFFWVRKRFRIRAAGCDVVLNDRSRNQSQRFEPPRHEGHQESQTPTVNRVSALRVGLSLVLLVPWWLRIRFGRRGAVNDWSAGKRSPGGTKKRSPPVMGILFH